MIFGAQINRFECADFPGRTCGLSRIRVQLKFFGLSLFGVGEWVGGVVVLVG